MKKRQISLIIIFLIILMSLSVAVCNASEFSFAIKENCSPMIFYITGAFAEIRERIINCDDVLIKCLFKIPKPQRSDIFKTIDEINRSIAETSTCL